MKKTTTNTTAALEFKPSKALTLGVEIEMQLIDPVTFGLTPKAEELLSGGQSHRKPEIGILSQHRRAVHRHL